MSDILGTSCDQSEARFNNSLRPRKNVHLTLTQLLNYVVVNSSTVNTIYIQHEGKNHDGHCNDWCGAAVKNRPVLQS